MNQVVRPLAAKKKIHSKDEFELCYLRHQYLRKCAENPDENEMDHYATIVVQQSKRTFFTYFNLFNGVGMEMDDVVSIGKTHIVSYLGLFALEKQPFKMTEFVRIFTERNGKSPSRSDIMNKNKANFTLFLKQRYEELVRICRQKARNIKGMPTEEYYVFCGVKRPPRFLRNLLEGHEKFGYKKLDISIFKSVKKKAKPANDKYFKYNETWYVCVPIEQRQLGTVDFIGADMDPYDSIHNMSPEQIYFDREQNARFQANKDVFDNFSSNEKANVIKNFIKEKRGQPLFREEVRTAKKLLKNLEIA